MSRTEPPEDARLVDLVLDENTIGRGNLDVEHEREVAIFDLLERNTFWPVGHESKGPNDYKLKLSLLDGRLIFIISDHEGAEVSTHILSLSPFRKPVRDYYQICESYYEAIRSSAPAQIEAIDMARRGLHDEGSQTLQDRLGGKIAVDFDTARRLFTLICVLHWKG